MDIELLLNELKEVVDEAGSVPFSKKVTVNPDDVYAILDDLKESIPQEIKDARWVNQERERILSEANTQAQQIIDGAEQKVQKAYDEANRKLKDLVSEHEITKHAHEEADRIVLEAKNTANTITTNSLAYVDQVLAKTSDEISKTLETIQENRSQLKY